MISSTLVFLTIILSSGMSEPIYGGISVGKLEINNNKVKVLNTNEFPFMVNIIIQETTQQDAIRTLKSYSYCGGTIIGYRTVLTAAHCITDSIYEPMISIRAGIVHLQLESELAQIVHVKYYHIHEKYVEHYEISPTLRAETINDIAIIWTDKSFIFDQSVNAAILPIGYSTTNAEFGWIIGWGKTDKDDMSLMLLKGRMKVTTKLQCQSSHPHILITDDMLCIISENRDVTACLWDSGGPFVRNGIVYGVCSFTSRKRTYTGREFCDSRRTNVYTRVGQYENWIKNSVIKFSRTQNIIETLQFTNGIFRSLIDRGNSKLPTTESTTKKPTLWQKVKEFKSQITPRLIVVR